MPQKNMPKKSAKKRDVNKTKGKRYSAAEKTEILAMVEKVNADRGRGGITAASKKFGVTALTIGSWLRSAGLPTRGGGRISKVEPWVFERLADLCEEIADKEEELSDLKRDYMAVKEKL